MKNVDPEEDIVTSTLLKNVRTVSASLFCPGSDPGKD